MFVPLHDRNPLRTIRFQVVTSVIFALNLGVFLFTHYSDQGLLEIVYANSLGTIPAVITNHASLDPALYLIPEPLTLVTYMFVHGSWLHIISNLLFLWVFADNIEDAFGHFGFLLFYLICGIIAAMAHIWFYPTSQVPLVGASGAVSAILASYLVLFPRTRIWVLLFFKIPLPITAIWALIGWLITQIIAMQLDNNDTEVHVAFWAHISGFFSGLIVTIALRTQILTRLGYIRH